MLSIVLNLFFAVSLLKKKKIIFYFSKYVEYKETKILKGYQLRYIYFIDKKYRKKLTVSEIPFSRIDELGAGMYKGENITRAERHVDEYCLK